MMPPSCSKGLGDCPAEERMQEFLIIVDMQKDFIDGALGTEEAKAVVAKVREKAECFQGKVIYTRDTHQPDYLQTQEGKNLPVPHCIRETAGWQIDAGLPVAGAFAVIDKPSFGSVELGEILREEDRRDQITRVTLAGLCTDICVISNALLLKAFLPETEIVVDATCCAGVTPESHEMALQAMKSCQIQIEG